MARVGRGIRAAAVLVYGQDAAEQQVATLLINQAGVTFTPTFPQSINMGFINQAAVIYGPEVEGTEQVLPGTIAQTPVLHEPGVVNGFQGLRPLSMLSNENWTDQDGNTTNLFGVLDEVSPDDADFIKSPYGPGADTVEFQLAPGSTPAGNDGHRLVYRYAKDPPAERKQLTVRLLEGAVIIATWTHTDQQHTFIEASQTLTEAQADSINDYTNLRVQFETVDV